MTCSEIGEYCEARQIKEKKDYTSLATLHYRIAEKLISAQDMKRPKYLSFDKLFPELKETAERASNITEEQKQILIIKKWKEFLR